MSAGRGRFFRCPTVFGATVSFKRPVEPELVVCGYEGRPERALKPRPSRKPVLICPSCLIEVK